MSPTTLLKAFHSVAGKVRQEGREGKEKEKVPDFVYYVKSQKEKLVRMKKERARESEGEKEKKEPGSR